MNEYDMNQIWQSVNQTITGTWSYDQKLRLWVFAIMYHKEKAYNTLFLKVSNSREQFMVFSILQKRNESHYPKHLSISIVRSAQDSDFCSFLEELRTPQIAFEIYWPLENLPGILLYTMNVNHK